ncbi:MAG: HEAT repeat domain-containing protein [candidate division Zixibacteria bacterium]|nr:HEAT repeat domain-containing protein [candidate division Zixibacteria bacterium]
MEQQLDALEHELDLVGSPYFREATDLFNFLMKAVKAKLVYPSSSKLPSQFKGELVKKADAIFTDIETLSYKISSNTINYGDKTVYESTSRTENFAHVLFRDGLIGLDFHEGVNEDELGRLIDLLSKMLRTVYVDDDLATLLWEENLQGITYTLIDDGLDIDTVEYSSNILKSDSDFTNDDVQSLYIDEGEITFEDDDFADAEHESGLSSHSKAYAQMPQETGEFLNRITEFSNEEEDQIADLLVEDAKFEHTEYLITVVFEILGMEKEIPGYVETLGFVGKVRDNFIGLGNFAGASALLKRMTEMLEVLSNLKSSRAQKIEGFFLDCASKDKIESITEAANNLKDIDTEGLISYLEQLPWAAIDPLLTSLGDLKYFKSRRAVCKVLAEIGKDQIDLVARGLDDERWYVVRNVVQVLGEIGIPRVINHLKKTIRHPDYRVRKETLNAAARITSSEVIDFMIIALSDPDVKIQLGSLDYLAQNHCVRAFRAIEHIVKDKKFKDRPPEQVLKFYEGLGLLGQDKAMPYLKPLATKRQIFTSSKDERMRIIAIKALGLVNTGEAHKILVKLTKSKNNKIASTAMRSASRKKRIS